MLKMVPDFIYSHLHKGGASKEKENVYDTIERNGFVKVPPMPHMGTGSEDTYSALDKVKT